MIAGRQNALILGPIGIGKTALVREALRSHSAVIWVSNMAPIKAALQEIVQSLVQLGRVSAEEAKSLARLSVPILSRSLSRALEGCVLVLDRLEQATPSMAPHLEMLLAAPVAIGLATELPSSPKLTRVWWRFQKKIHLQSLSSGESRELFWNHVPRETLPDPRAWERTVSGKGGGNPMAILELAAQARQHPEAVGSDHPAGRREIDLTPGLLLLGAGVIAARFVALGLNDVDTYILAGVGGAFFVVARYFIYRLLRRRTS